MTSRLEKPVRQIIELLVRKDYAGLVVLTKGRRLTAENIRHAIHDYGRTLSLPPPEAYGGIDAIQIVGRDPPSFSVQMRLWTEEEGDSDLSVELTLTESNEDFEIELDDIHVL